MLKRFVPVLVLLLLALRGSPAVADEAKTLYKRAETAFALGRFADSAELFEKVFELKQDPAVLYDAAQSHRLAGNKQKALVLYQNYLRMFGERQNRTVVEKRIAELKVAIEAEKVASTNPPTELFRDKPEATDKPESEPTPPAPVAQPAPVTSPALALTQPAPAPPPKKPLARRGWFWGVVAGSVVAVGAGVALGVVLGTSSHSPAITLGTVKAN